jgi:hypothetical protein
MPLQSSQTRPTFDVTFQMLTQGGRSVRCRVTRGALERLLGEAGGSASANSDQAFLELRPRVENIASRKFDAHHVERNAFLLIGPEDLDAAQEAADRHQSRGRKERYSSARR